VDAPAGPDRAHVAPSTAPGAPGGHTVLVSLLPELGGQLSFELRREGTVPDAGRVCLRDADHVGDACRADSYPGARPAGDRARGGHVGIGSVIEIEVRALRALEQDALPSPHRRV